MYDRTTFMTGLTAGRRMFEAYTSSLMDKSRSVLRFFQNRMARVCIAWLVVMIGLSLMKLAFPATPIHNIADALPILIVYTSVIAAPILGYLVARHAFVGDAAQVQPSYRFAVVGKWQKLSMAAARRKENFGPAGFMASLLIGLILNVVIRTAEFFTAVPAMSMHAPSWGMGMFLFMGFDLVATSFFYMAAFAMALRTIPLFPRMLAFAWMLDIAMQLFVARSMGEIAGIPDTVIQPLSDLLSGNITKALISIAVWLPYLLLSERVNITYRHRTYAG